MKPLLTRLAAALAGALALAGLLIGAGHAQAPPLRAAILSSAIESNARQWAAAVATNAGTVSPARLALVSTLVRSLKAAGTWQITDDCWLLVAENAPQALTSLKQRRLATAVNSPTFTADRGYAFDGSTNYIDTSFIPITHAIAMTASNVRAAVYERTNVTATGYAMGVNQNSGRIISIRPRQASDLAAVTANWTGGTFTLPSADSRGLTSVSRNGPDVTTVAAYRNAVAMARASDPTAYGATLPTTSLFIGGLNSAGSLTSGRASTVGWGCIGAAYTADQETGAYRAIQAHMTVLGAGV